MFDAYEVSVRLKLVDQFSSVMGMVVNKLIEGNTHADKLQKKFESIGKMFATGALLTGAGTGMAMALKAATNEAVKYEQQLNRLKALQLGDATTSQLINVASNTAKSIKGISQTEAMRLTTESMSITADAGHAAEIVPELAKMRFAIETYMNGGGKGEGHGEKSEGMFRDVVKAAEMRGLMRDFSMGKFQGMMDTFTKMYVASGGQVGPNQILQMMKTGGVAAKSVNQDFLFGLGHLMQESGGSRSGTAMMSGYQNLVAGRTTQQVAEKLASLGMLEPGSIKYGATGHIKKIDPGALKETDLFIANPLEYLTKVILPALEKKGIDTGNQNAVLKQINQMYSNKVASQLMSQIYLDRDQLGKYIQMSKGVAGYEQLYTQGGTSAVGMQGDLRRKVADLELRLGTAALPLLKSALEQLIPLVERMGKWLGSHQDGLKNLLQGAAALAVVFMASGPLMVIGSGFKLLSTTLTLLAGPLGNVAVALAFQGVGGAAGLASVAGSLATVGGQLKLLGAATAVFGAYWAGSKIGDFINEHLSDKAKDAIGGTIATVLASLGSKEAQAAIEADMNAKSGLTGHLKTAGAGRGFAVHTTLNVDGRAIAKSVSNVHAKELGRPPTGGRAVDPRITPTHLAAH
jgi:hypothetical protein